MFTLHHGSPAEQGVAGNAAHRTSTAHESVNETARVSLFEKPANILDSAQYEMDPIIIVIIVTANILSGEKQEYSRFNDIIRKVKSWFTE